MQFLEERHPIFSVPPQSFFFCFFFALFRSFFLSPCTISNQVGAEFFMLQVITDWSLLWVGKLCLHLSWDSLLQQLSWTGFLQYNAQADSNHFICRHVCYSPWFVCEFFISNSKNILFVHARHSFAFELKLGLLSKVHCASLNNLTSIYEYVIGPFSAVSYFFLKIKKYEINNWSSWNSRNIESF